MAAPKGNKFSPGRPSDYREEYDEMAFRYALLGKTDKEMAELFAVSEVTLNAWKKKHLSFLKSLNAGKIEADTKVAESLYQKALGYSHPDTHIAVSNGEVIQTPIIKHYPPDTTSAIFWLKNRQSGKWRDKQPDERDNNQINIYLDGKDVQL